MSDDKCWDQQLIPLKCTDTLCDIYNCIKIQEIKHIVSALTDLHQRVVWAKTMQPVELPLTI